MIGSNSKAGNRSDQPPSSNNDEQAGLFDQVISQVAAVSPNSEATKPVKDHRAGHRDRLRERFREGGSDAMPDYELLARFGTRGDIPG